VIDDGSTDHTRAVVSAFTENMSPAYDARVRYFYQENAGKSAAVNRALEHIRGQYVAILDADDQLPPTGLEARYNAIELAEGEPPELVIGGFEVFDGDKTLGKRPAPNTVDSNVLRRQFFFSYKTPFHLNSCLIAHSLIHRVGKMDEKLHRSHDQDYNIRVLEEAKGVSIVDNLVYQYRKYRSTHTERIKYRLRDLIDRPKMICKHTKGMARIFAIGMAGMYDLGKLIYEIRGAYHN